MSLRTFLTSPISLFSALFVIGGVPFARSEVAGPGWQLMPAPVLEAQSPGASPQVVQPDTSGTSNINLLATVAYSGADALAITPELQALATGLDNDPVKIFNYVHNKIAFQPYSGSHKGAHVTYLDGAGNDMDQASLLIALLKQAGYTTVSYVVGVYHMPDTSTDGHNLSNWLGTTTTTAPYALASGGVPFHGGTNFGTYIVWNFDHVWVRATINGTVYDLDPSYKQNQIFTGIDYKTASGYSRSQLLTDAGGTVTADYVQNASRANVESRLGQYTTNLLASIKANQPNADIEQIIGGKRVLEQPVSALSAAAPLTAFTPAVSTTFTTIPASYVATYRAQVGTDIDVTFNVHSLQGNRLSLVFVSNQAQLWLGDTMVAQETSGSGTTVSVTLTITSPSGTSNQAITATYNRTGAYDLTYSFYANPRSNGEIDASNRQLQNYLASGLTDSSRQVLTETLHGLGLKWIRRVNMAASLVASEQNVFVEVVHIFGRSGQENGYYVDMPGVFEVTLNGSSTSPTAFNMTGLLGSAMEHGVIEQTGGSAALSTIKCLALANDGGQKIFRATSANYSSTVSSQLTNYSAGQLSAFSTAISGGSTLFLHANGQTGINQWKGFGYEGLNNSTVSMIIAGGYSGGYNSTTAQVSGTAVVKFIVDAPKPAATAIAPTSPEPVNLLTGAYTMAHADLTLGDVSSPRGLNFSRFYDSSRNFSPSTLGNGWRHSCEGKVTFSSELDNAFGLSQATDAAQTIIGALAVSDFASTSGSAQELLVGALAANWTVNRITNNVSNVQIGNQGFSYTSQPDGSWNPPPGSTTTMSGASGSLVLHQRFGGSVTFDAQNRLSQWQDIDLNTETFTYDATSGKLTTVTDQFGRTLTFTYNAAGTSADAGLLQKVQDPTGRSVQFTYTAGTFSGSNLTGIVDPESNSTSLVYDSRNRLTDWKDAANLAISHNDYDGLDRVYQQLSQNLASHTWLFHYSPGATIQIDPAGGETTSFFDYKSRSAGTIDALGNASTLSYDGQNHITTAIDATGRQTTFIYDSNQNLTQTSDNAGHNTTFQYDASLRLWKATDATGKTTISGYDAKNHLTSVTDPGSRQTSYAYRSDGLLDHVTDAANRTTTFTSYDSYGNPTTITRADGTTNSATYNQRGDLLTSTDGRGETTTYTYDKRRLLLTRQDALLNSTTYTYDGNGYPASVTDRNGHTTTFTFDNLGHRTAVQAPDTGAMASGYDIRDWQTSMADGLGHATNFGYDAAGRLASTTNALSIITTQSTYDAAGRLSTQQDGLLQTTQFFYDTAGRLDHTRDPLNHDTTHSYDDANRPLTLTDRRGHAFTFGYAADGLPTTFTYPSSRQSQVVSREASGLPKIKQSPGGQQTVLTYDAMKRLSGLSDGIGQIAWTYDNEGNATDVTETIRAVPTTTIHRVFDALGRVTRVTDTLGYTVSYTYDNEGNVATITYPYTGAIVSYTYDGANRLKTVTDWAGRVTTYTYDSAGRLQTVLRPNHTRQRRNFDVANRLTGSFEELMSGSTVSSTLWQASYGYDNANRLTSFTPAPAARPLAPAGVTLTYDSDNQLATYNGQTVSHDLEGNLLSAPVSGTLLGGLTWDKRNRLTGAGGTSYTYDAENRRIESTENELTTQYIYARGSSLDRLLMKVNPDGSYTSYVYGAGGLLYEETQTLPVGASNPPVTVYYHFDWRGDTVALSDANGTVTARLNYSPYGERTIESGAVTTPFCFNGQAGVMTEPTGLLSMQARFYSPVLRRFLNEDPSGFAGGNNLYAYCAGDPVDLMDPFGLGPSSGGGSANPFIDTINAGYAAGYQKGLSEVNPTTTVIGGQASVYGSADIAGNPTAYFKQKGYTYDPNAMAAAMPADLAGAGTVVTVEYDPPDGGSATVIEVTVTDKGPWATDARGRAIHPLQINPDRPIDLTPAAMQALTGKTNNLVDVTVTIPSTTNQIIYYPRINGQTQTSPPGGK